MRWRKPQPQLDMLSIKAPWIYINDSSDSCYGYKISALIPSTLQVVLSDAWEPEDQILSIIQAKEYEQTVVIISDKRADKDDQLKVNTLQFFRESAIRHGCNFASVNFCNDSALTPFKTSNLGPNHLNVEIGLDNVADHIYQWLFSALSVRETLYLIPEQQMREIDTENFSAFAYCPISESRKRPKDAKIQFVALILDKPQVRAGNILTWSVADKTGFSTFYFQYRGPQSQYTWDWVLSFNPGDRKALPRMPMVKVKEKKRVTIAKAPLRLTSVLVGGAGLMITGVGQALTYVGDVVKLGNRSEWIPEADVGANGKRIVHSGCRVTLVTSDVKRQMKIFNEKGQKTCSDKDSVASTEAGSVYNEKTNQDFV